jgi:NTP pyrophosphatase (non-canonical NTP hydrolase)
VTKANDNASTEKKSTLDRIREALENREEYAGVWEEAKAIVQQKIDSNEELSETQKAEYTKRLQGFYDEVIGKPFSDKQAEQATKEGLKELGVNIDKVIRDHYTIYDATKRTLQEKLIEEAGELAKALLKNDKSEIIDAIGDMIVVLTNLAKLENLLIEDCVLSAYDVIKNRKGKMENGTFVKEK